jgi:hypothetical protein
MAAVAVAATAGVGYAQEPPPTQQQQQQQQQPPPPAQQQAEQPDLLHLKSSSPIILINQVKVERMADFEAGWTELRAAFAKVTAPEIKAFGETLSKLYKVDLPVMDTPGGKAQIYIFEIESPSTTISYNPSKILFETLHKAGGALTYDEAMAIYKKLDGVYISINPWPLVKVG